MSLGRTLRTIRHLSAEQWYFRFVCRGRWVAARRLPGLFRAHIERTERALPLPIASTAGLTDAAKLVLLLQQSVHGAHLDGMTRGCFRFLGRTVDFGSIAGIEWRRDLGERNNPLWRMNLSYLGWLVPLLADGRPDSLALTGAILESLENQNPWSEPGVFRDVWHPYSVSHRLINLLTGLALYRAAGGAPSPNFESAIAAHVRLCAAFLLHNLERDLQYNHLLKNFVALSVYSAALSRPLPRLNFLRNAIRRSLQQQVLPDGGHAERAPMYHALCLLDLEILKATGEPVEHEISAMKLALAAMMHPDGDIALFNDSWLGEVPPAKMLAPAPPDGIADLPQTGYVRLGRGGDAAILDRGPCGPDNNPGHAHADFLSVELSVEGKRLLVDPGVPTYSAGTLRDECRSASRHNGPHLRGREPIEFWQSFRVGRRGYAYPLDGTGLGTIAPLWAAGRQDGYKPYGVNVARWIGLWPGRAFLMVDVWQGISLAQAGLRFLIPAEWKRNGLTFENAGSLVRLDVLNGGAAVGSPGTWWPRFGEANDAHAISVAPLGTEGNATAATLWLWGEEPEAARPSAAAIAKSLSEALESVR